MGLLEDRRWQVALAAVVVAMVAYFGGYSTGKHGRFVTEDARCLSMQTQIGCTLPDGWEVAVPLDVPWTDASGTWHEGSRPDCLPPHGRGAEPPVGVTWTDVEADGTGWRQVIHVTCYG